jgi:hypothetical protein
MGNNSSTQTLSNDDLKDKVKNKNISQYTLSTIGMNHSTSSLNTQMKQMLDKTLSSTSVNNFTGGQSSEKLSTTSLSPVPDDVVTRETSELINLTESPQKSNFLFGGNINTSDINDLLVSTEQAQSTIDSNKTIDSNQYNISSDEALHGGNPDEVFLSSSDYQTSDIRIENFMKQDGGNINSDNYDDRTDEFSIQLKNNITMSEIFN